MHRQCCRKFLTVSVSFSLSMICNWKEPGCFHIDKSLRLPWCSPASQLWYSFFKETQALAVLVAEKTSKMWSWILDDADTSLHRACNKNNGRCELLPLSLLSVSSNIQQWCLIVYIKYFISYVRKKDEAREASACPSFWFVCFKQQQQQKHKKHQALEVHQ